MWFPLITSTNTQAFRVLYIKGVRLAGGEVTK